MSDNYVTLKEFTVNLHELCKAKESKIIFFTSDLDRAGRLVVDSGNIVSMRFFNKSGQQALDAILEIDTVKFRIDEMPAGIVPDSDIPPSQAIFSKLLSVGDSPSPQVASAPVESQLLASEKESIERNLIDIIGPMGSVLCKDVLQTAANIQQVIGELSNSLSPEDLEALKKSLNIT